MSLFAMRRRKGCPGARRQCPIRLCRSPPREKEAAMAARSLIKEFCEEITCSVCLEYFKEPVILDCGHNFCQACLTQCWEEPGRGTSCPQCRESFQQRNFKPNWQLANLVELVKKLQTGKGAEGKWRMCERHQEPLKLFCNDDQASICVVCDRSMGHRNHNVLPMEEAFLEYKKEIQSQLQSLEHERETFKEHKVVEDQKSQTLLVQLEAEKEKTKLAFQRMQSFLEQQERLRLSQLEKLEGEIKIRDEENLTRFSEEISELNHQILDREEKFQQLENRFVQDPKTILNRYEMKTERQLLEVPPIVEQTHRIYLEQTPGLQKVLEACEESLKEALVQVLRKVNVTLDPDTAHPCLFISKDLKSVTRSQTVQNLPNNPERFDTLQSVLGREKFTSGRHSWEVEVLNGQALWGVGVARESVQRKGNIFHNPAAGFWVVQTASRYDSFSGRTSWQMTASTSSQSTVLSGVIPQKIQVSLDYEEGRVEFFVANQRLFAFPSSSFCGEVLCPYFYILHQSTLKC